MKSFSWVKIDDLKHNLSQMYLSRYQNIVLHVGGHAVDANINRTSFRDNYSSLLNYVSQQTCNVFVSGLLPRGGKNVKPFNEVLADLCKSTKAKFIDNHDSFVMASGKLLFDLFCPDKMSLKFSGTRKLVQNINRYCSLLPEQYQNHGTRLFKSVRQVPS